MKKINTTNMKTVSKQMLFSVMLVSALAACDNKGTAESVGRKIDQATEDASTAISNSADKIDQSAADATKSSGQALDDAKITTKLKAALLDEPNLKSLKITVTTKQGVVHLSGSVNSAASRDKVVRLAKSIEGVSGVVDNLLIAN